MGLLSIFRPMPFKLKSASCMGLMSLVQLPDVSFIPSPVSKTKVNPASQFVVFLVKFQAFH